MAPSLADRPMRVLRDSKHKSSARCTLAATILRRLTHFFGNVARVTDRTFKDSWLMHSFSPHLISLKHTKAAPEGG